MASLELTEDQIEILGYALTATLRIEKQHLTDMRVVLRTHPGPFINATDAMAGAQARIQRIEELRRLLDAVPAEPCAAA